MTECVICGRTAGKWEEISITPLCDRHVEKVKKLRRYVAVMRLDTPIFPAKPKPAHKTRRRVLEDENLAALETQQAWNRMLGVGREMAQDKMPELDTFRSQERERWRKTQVESRTGVSETSPPEPEAAGPSKSPASSNGSGGIPTPEQWERFVEGKYPTIAPGPPRPSRGTPISSGNLPIVTKPPRTATRRPSGKA